MLEYPSHDIFLSTAKSFFNTRYAQSENLQIQMLRAALDRAPDAVLVTDQLGQFVYFNESFISLYRHKKTDPLTAASFYSHIFEATLPDGSTVPFESWPISRALRGETGANQEYKILRRDTGESWIGLYNFSPIRDSESRIIGAIVIGRDITEEKNAAQKLKDSESRARILLEKSTEKIVGLNLDGTYCFVNESYAKMLNTTPEQILGRALNDVLPQDRAEERLRAMREAVQTGQKQTVELSLRDARGNERFFVTTADPILDEHGKPQWVLFVAIEITERKSAENKLSESEAKYRRLFEQNSDALLLFDSQSGEILAANPATEALYDYTREELIGQKVYTLAAQRQELDRTIRHASAEGFFSATHQNHRKKNGAIFPVEIKMTSFELGSRKVMQSIIQDMGFRLRYENRLKEISRRLQLATDSAKLGIWDWDIQSDTILWDDRMHELYGKPKTAGIGRKGVNEWAELIHPEDRDRVLNECLAASRDKNIIYDTEFRVIHSDHSIRHLKANGLVVWNEDGTADHMIGINADITSQKEAESSLRKAYSEIENKVRARTTELTLESERLKESERRLKRAQELGRIGHWSSTLSFDHIEWSDEVYRIFGFEPQSIQATVDLFYSLILPEWRDQARQTVEDAFKQGRSYEITYPFKRPDGSTGFAQSTAEAIFDKDGTLLKYSGVIQDVTEQKMLEQELRSAVELRDEFMSIASHELKTPLTALNMQLQLLDRIVSTTDSDVDPRIFRMSLGALASAKSLSNLIDDLLDVTRIRTGKLTISKEKMDLKAVLEKSVQEMQPEALRASTQIHLLAPEEVIGKWDPARITQIVRNLVSNAIKYGNGSPVIVTLAKDSHEAQITVRDNGVGISKELQSQIFERFQRADAGNKITGLGLGLYIVRQIVDAHGGLIQVESEPNKGSLFTVRLPRNKHDHGG